MCLVQTASVDTLYDPVSPVCFCAPFSAHLFPPPSFRMPTCLCFCMVLFRTLLLHSSLSPVPGFGPKIRAGTNSFIQLFQIQGDRP